MAAYIAKQEQVKRVVLSSPGWDHVGKVDREPAPWTAKPSVTPMERWWAAYHKRENEAALISKVLASLQVPPDHITVFTGPLPQRAVDQQSSNPYHNSNLGNMAYIGMWQQFFTGITDFAPPPQATAGGGKNLRNP
jgi:hypothetical protein